MLLIGDRRKYYQVLLYLLVARFVISCLLSDETIALGTWLHPVDVAGS